MRISLDRAMWKSRHVALAVLGGLLFGIQACSVSQQTDQQSQSVTDSSRVKWAFRTVQKYRPMAIRLASNGNIYVGTAGPCHWSSCDGNLYSISPGGTLNWTFDTGAIADDSLMATGRDGTVYVGGWDSDLRAINTTGALNWKFPMLTTTLSFFSSSPDTRSVAVGADGTVYATSWDTLHAITPGGFEKWTSKIGNLASVAVGDNMVYAQAWVETNLYAIHPNGSQMWKLDLKVGLFALAVGGDGTTYVGTSDGVRAINPNGSRGWGARLRDATDNECYVNRLAIAHDGTVCAMCYSRPREDTGTLHVFSRNGSHKWQFNSRSDAGGSLAVGNDGTIYVGSEYSCGLLSACTGKVYALNSDGSLKWSFSAGGGVRSLAVGNDGTVYAGTEQGLVYALKP
jgi:hypothetical protein